MNEDWPTTQAEVGDAPDLRTMDEDAQCREVFAWAGLALYHAQVLEHGLVNLLVLLDAAGLVQPVTPETIDDLYREGFRKTLGQAVRKLNEHGDQPIADMRSLQEALDRRNALAHSFFRERATEFVSVGGRQGMVLALRQMCNSFVAADRDVTTVHHDLLRRAGITAEEVQAAYDQLLGDSAD